MRGDRPFVRFLETNRPLKTRVQGNKYRLIVGIDYGSRFVYYKYLLTHADYDKNRWKNDPYF